MLCASDIYSILLLLLFFYCSFI